MLQEKTLHPHAMSPLRVPSFSSFCSTPPPTWTPSPAKLTGIRPNPCATPLLEGQSGHLADPTPKHRLKNPKLCIDVSSEHTPITVQEKSFNLENHLTTTVAAAEDSDHFPQRLAASGSQHPVASTVPTWLSPGSSSGTWKLVRGSDSVASVEESVLRDKKRSRFEKCETSSDRQTLHNYLKRKADSAVGGKKCSSEKTI